MNNIEIKEYHGAQLYADWSWERRPKKKEWIAAARQSFNPREDLRDLCCICKMSFELTEAHHVIPLSVQYEKGFVRPDHRHVWLCPTHHSVIHWLLRFSGGDAAFRCRRLKNLTSMMRHENGDEEIEKFEILYGYAGGAN